jgi:hypothetical protein
MSSDNDNFPATPTTSGWYPVNDGSDQETFWDGTAWTKRRQYRFGSPFLEIPLHQSDPPLAPVAPVASTPPASTSMTSTWSDSSKASMNRPVPYVTRAPSAPSPSFQTSRRRLRFIQLIYVIAILGFFFSSIRHPGDSADNQRFFLYVFVFALVLHVFVRLASSRARRDIRDQETGRRPAWPFRYLSRLTEGLQGPLLASFVGGMRTQPRIGPVGFNASVPLARLSIFSNGLRVGPSSSLLSLMVPTWEARFDELDDIQAIGRLKGLTTGILLRKAQSHEWVVFWTLNRDEVFTALEHMGIIVSREPVRFRVGKQWRESQFVEDELRPSTPSVLGSAASPTATATGTTAAATGPSSPLVFATPPTWGAPERSTTASNDRKWPGVVIPLFIVFMVLSINVLVFGLIRVSDPIASNDTAGDTTVTTPIPVVTVSPVAWRASIGFDARSLAAVFVDIPNSIAHLRYNSGVTQNSYDLLDLTNDLQSVNYYCPVFHYIAGNGAPTPSLATGAMNVSVACDDLVRVDQADLKSSNNKWTPQLASDSAHWLTIFKERLTLLQNEATK